MVGHDGILIEKDEKLGDSFGGEEYAEDSYVTFDPNQIKSAFGNTGEFDPANPDIRYRKQDYITDDNGKPKTVYHGTRATFDSFDTSKIGTGQGMAAGGEGFYFTDDLRLAAPHTKDPNTGEHVGRIVHARLKMKNLYRMPSAEWDQDMPRAEARKRTQELREQG